MDCRRLLLVDDHALFREGLAGLFAYRDDFEVVGETSDADAALARVAELHPDIVVTDIDMPGDDGIATTRRLKSEYPEVTAVMLTVHDATNKLLDAIKAGAQGYLVKNIRSSELLDQLRGLRQGEAAITRRMAARILEEFQRGHNSVHSQDEAGHDVTVRELEVLELVADRLSNKEIAARLVISEHTVRNHLKNILGKLQLRTRREAADYGLAQVWCATPDMFLAEKLAGQIRCRRAHIQHELFAKCLGVAVVSPAARRPNYADLEATAASASTCPISGSHGARIKSSHSAALYAAMASCTRFSVANADWTTMSRYGPANA
jgi:DNA-binding NarL/FixJ family response regulator